MRKLCISKREAGSLASAASPFILSGSKLLRSSGVGFFLAAQVVVQLWVSLLFTVTTELFIADRKIAISHTPQRQPTMLGAI